MAHCQPYLVQLLCALLVERMNSARRMPPASLVEVADVDAVIPLALERGQGYFHDLLRTQTGGEPAQRLLEALARTPGERLSAAALRAAQPDEAALRVAIATLMRRELIERDGDGYCIIVPLVAEYVRRAALI
jgi:hypothetical protein